MQQLWEPKEYRQRKDPCLPTNGRAGTASRAAAARMHVQEQALVAADVTHAKLSLCLRVKSHPQRHPDPTGQAPWPSRA